MSRPRLAVVLAAIAVVSAMLLGGLQSVVWHGDEAPGLARAVASLVAPGLLGRPAASSMLEPPSPYFAVGRWTLAVYLLLWLVAACERTRWRSWPGRLGAVAGVAATVGDALAYWVSDSTGPWLRRVGFWWIELPALGVVVLALTAVAVATWRRDGAGRWLAAAIPAAAAGTVALRYLPHGILAGIGVALLACAARARASIHELAGLRVLITGGTTGIGRATATLLQRRGARVVVCARRGAELPAGIAFVACDLCRSEQRHALAERVIGALGGLDVLINNAAIQVPVALQERDAWSRVAPELALDLEAPVHLTTLLLPELLQAGRPAAIVNVTSALSFAPKPGTPGYCAAKAALASFSTTLRAQLEGTSVRVLELVPPLVDTAMTAGRAGAKVSPDVVAQALVDGLARGTRRVLVGKARVLWMLHRLSPRMATRMLAKD